MKRILSPLPIIIAAVVATSALSFAADDKPKRPEGAANRAPGERLKALAEKLSLTDEQKDKLKDIFAKNMDKLKAIREDSALSAEDKRAKLMEIRKGEMEELRAILTPEQQEKMKEMRAKRGEAKPGDAK